ncbi:hypothetical protein ACFOG5_11565 [Pedobacter fastidiosus]|uniref:Lipoprotein n=1 Tax=Pedobacter fastidiosus TaxID=2765361 RepID=A0ABR7KZ11_9SPHI|nr:hypothetical protein [Pedobacter fastidiosus]MBC6112943.1 hypothetical protein [Pedobacter fastidiosus]
MDTGTKNSSSIKVFSLKGYKDSLCGKMLKLISVTFFLSIATSCNSQTDLESLSFDQDISKVIENHKEFRKNTGGSNGLKAYSSSDLDGFKIGSAQISTYELPKGNASDHSDLWIFIDNYNSKKFLGYSYSSANEDESKKVLNYLKSKYKRFVTNTDKTHGDFYFWDLPELNKWIFVDQANSINHIQTTFTVVKRGLRVENSTNKSVFTIYDVYKMMNPDVLK